MSVHTSADRPERLRVQTVRKALTGEEAGRILEASEEGKNLRSSTVVLIFEHGRLQSSNVYKKVAA